MSEQVIGGPAMKRLLFAGGVLGTSTSLTGVPPALLLTRRGIPTKPFLADLATYFVAPTFTTR